MMKTAACRNILHSDLTPGNVLLAARQPDEADPRDYSCKVNPMSLHWPVQDMPNGHHAWH